MTDQQPQTPTTEVVKDAACFPRDRLGEPRGIDPDAFNRWLATVEAAAEQREKEQAWDEGYRDGYNDGLSDGHSLDNMRDPNENPYRTDQEGDE